MSFSHQLCYSGYDQETGGSLVCIVESDHHGRNWQVLSPERQIIAGPFKTKEDAFNVGRERFGAMRFTNIN